MSNNLLTIYLISFNIVASSGYKEGAKGNYLMFKIVGWIV